MRLGRSGAIFFLGRILLVLSVATLSCILVLSVAALSRLFLVLGVAALGRLFLHRVATLGRIILHGVATLSGIFLCSSARRDLFSSRGSLGIGWVLAIGSSVRASRQTSNQGQTSNGAKCFPVHILRSNV